MTNTNDEERAPAWDEEDDGSLGMFYAEMRHAVGGSTRAVWLSCKLGSRAVRGYTPTQPKRTDRRQYDIDDFPGVDWDQTGGLVAKVTGLSLPVVYRLQSEHQDRKAKANLDIPE